MEYSLIRLNGVFNNHLSSSLRKSSHNGALSANGSLDETLCWHKVQQLNFGRDYELASELLSAVRHTGEIVLDGLSDLIRFEYAKYFAYLNI